MNGGIFHQALIASAFAMAYPGWLSAQGSDASFCSEKDGSVVHLSKDGSIGFNEQQFCNWTEGPTVVGQTTSGVADCFTRQVLAVREDGTVDFIDVLPVRGKTITFTRLSDSEILLLDESGIAGDRYHQCGP